MKFPLLDPENRTEFERRISKVRESMREAGADAILVASTVNIFYLTGGVCIGYIYIDLEKTPLFFTIPPAPGGEGMMINVRKPELIPGILEEKGYSKPRCAGLELGELSYNDATRLKKLFVDSEICDATSIMRGARITKTDQEIEKMREDGVKQCAAYSKIGGLYKPGMTDLDLQIEIERVLRLEGCLGYLRTAGSKMEINLGSVIAGPNADVPSPYDFAMGGGGVDPSLPVGASGILLKPGMTVMVDMNGGFNGYQTDMTRCWYVENTDDRAVRAHECSREILRDLETYSRPGVEIGDLSRRAEDIVSKAGLAQYFMGHRHKVSFIGHGVGIELNEQPVLMSRNKSLLHIGMTIAIEPKFVIPGIGAVGVENTYVVRPDRLENLTPFPEELAELR